MPRFSGACLGGLLALGACGNPDAASLPTLSLACEAVIPPADSGSGRVSRVAPGRNGRLAWSDGRPGQFLLRDSTGPTRLVGREGSGPGEFRNVSQMGWLGDTLWVGNFPEPRVQFFSDTGALLRGASALSMGSWQGRPDGRLVGFAALPVRFSLGEPSPIPVLAHRPGATAPDTVVAFPHVPSESLMLPIGGQEFATIHPLFPRTQVAGDPAGSRFCAAIPTAADGIRLWCVDDHGRQLVDRELRLPLRPVTDSVYDAVVAFFADVPGRTVADVQRRMSRPPHLPVVIQMMVANSGETWLRRSEPREPEQWWLRLNRDGTMRDQVVFPAPHRILWVGGDTVWAAIPDSDDLETLSRCVLGREK